MFVLQSSSLSSEISNGFVIGKIDRPFSSSNFSLAAVAGFDLFMLYTLMRWQDEVTWRSQFLFEKSAEHHMASK